MSKNIKFDDRQTQIWVDRVCKNVSLKLIPTEIILFVVNGHLGHKETKILFSKSLQVYVYLGN